MQIRAEMYKLRYSMHMQLMFYYIHQYIESLEESATQQHNQMIFMSLFYLQYLSKKTASQFTHPY